MLIFAYQHHHIDNIEETFLSLLFLFILFIIFYIEVSMWENPTLFF